MRRGNANDMSAPAPRERPPAGGPAVPPAALSSVAISPREVVRRGASSKTRSPHTAVSAAIACVSARPAEQPRQLAGLPAPALRGCQPLLPHGGTILPYPPH